MLTALLAMVLTEWLQFRPALAFAALGLAIYIWRMVPYVAWSRWVFLAIAAMLTVIVIGDAPKPWDLIETGLRNGAFIAAFFVAQATLRHAAMSSDAIARCGRYLASQPPGRRYLALTSGGHFFGLVLSYGAISLLGGMSVASTDKTALTDAQRKLRKRRMLLATQRGFVSTLSWSPLAFSYAVSTSIIPGSSWAGAVQFGIVSAVLLASLGWLLDRLVKPAGAQPAAVQTTGSRKDLWPLAILLCCILGSVAILQSLSGVRMVGVVLLAVPLVSMAWVIIQGAAGKQPSKALISGKTFIDTVIPSYRSEIVLLAAAAYIGTLGSHILLPLTGESGHVLGALPSWLILAGIVWIVPLCGLLGMNPVLSVSLLAPLLPPPDVLHTTPDVLVAAITAGWALSGALSPFTATTLIVGLLGGLSAWRVGLVWNGTYTMLAGTLLSLWVILAAIIQG